MTEDRGHVQVLKGPNSTAVRWIRMATVAVNGSGLVCPSGDVLWSQQFTGLRTVESKTFISRPASPDVSVQMFQATAVANICLPFNRMVDALALMPSILCRWEASETKCPSQG